MGTTFEATCGMPTGTAKCNTRITTRDGGQTWRHDNRPADRHEGQPVGDMRQI